MSQGAMIQRKPTVPTSSSPPATFRRELHHGRSSTKTGQRKADEEDEEDRAMDRNPSDYPFPAFQPSEADIVRKKRRALNDIDVMTKGLRAVVPFSKPDMSGCRPPWHSNVFVTRDPTPKMDWAPREVPKLAIPEPGPSLRDAVTEAPPLKQPKWINHLSRPVQGCPQLGLPIEFEDETKRHRHRPAPPETARPARDGQSIHKLLHTASKTPRFAIDHRDDAMLELIRDKAFLKEIYKHAKQRKSLLVTLPKIGVRLFSFAGAPTLADCIMHDAREESSRTSGAPFGTATAGSTSTEAAAALPTIGGVRQEVSLSTSL